MSDDGNPTHRLSAALDEVFSRSRPAETRAAADVSTAPEGAVDGSAPDETYVLPEIVPATEEPADTVAPSLPARATVPEHVAPVGAAPAAAPVAAPLAAAGEPATRPVVTSWSDHVAPARTATLRAPGRKPRVRRVTRVVRHIDPWSTFKVGLLFSLVAYLVALTSGVLLWQVADSTGTLDNVERWFTQFGWETFELKGGEIFHNAWIIGLFGVVGMTGGVVLLATVFNLVSDIIGGVRVTVLEEEVVERTASSTRRYVVRHGPPVAAGPATQQWDVDDEPSTAPSDQPLDAPADAPADATVDAASERPAASRERVPTPPPADWSVD